MKTIGNMKFFETPEEALIEVAKLTPGQKTAILQKLIWKIYYPDFDNDGRIIKIKTQISQVYNEATLHP